MPWHRGFTVAVQKISNDMSVVTGKRWPKHIQRHPGPAPSFCGSLVADFHEIVCMSKFYPFHITPSISYLMECNKVPSPWQHTCPWFHDPISVSVWAGPVFSRRHLAIGHGEGKGGKEGKESRDHTLRGYVQFWLTDSFLCGLACRPLCPLLFCCSSCFWFRCL